jgi:hypothetical protein
LQPPFSGLDPRIEKRFDEMERRMDQMMKILEGMSGGRAEHQEEK